MTSFSVNYIKNDKATQNNIILKKDIVIKKEKINITDIKTKNNNAIAKIVKQANDKNKTKRLKIEEKEKKHKEQKEINELQIKWQYLMGQTDTFNKFKKSFGLNNIECTDYGFSLRIYAPTALYIDELEKLKPYIETEFACEFMYKLRYTETNENAYAEAKIVHPNKVKCNSIPFVPYDVKPYEVYVGVNVAGESIIKNVNIYSHILLAGQTRRGKNGCLDHILTSWIHSCTEKEIQLYLFQCAKKDLKKYQNCKQVCGYTEDLTEMFFMLEHILDDMKNRSNILEPMLLSWKGDNIFDYNKAHKGHELPYCYVIIDEFLALMPEESDNKEMKQLKLSIQSQLRAIGQHGGAVGVNYLVSHQKPEKLLCPTFLKNMSNIRICFGFSDSVCSRIVLGNDMAMGLPPRKAIIYDGEEFEIIYTTDLQGRMERYIKPNVLLSHKTIFDDLKKIGEKTQGSFNDNKNKGIGDELTKDTNKKDKEKFKEQQEKLKLKQLQEDLLEQKKELAEKEKEMAIRDKEFEKEKNEQAKKIIKFNSQRKTQQADTFKKVEIVKETDKTGLSEEEINSIVETNKQKNKGWVDWVPPTPNGKEKTKK